MGLKEDSGCHILARWRNLLVLCHPSFNSGQAHSLSLGVALRRQQVHVVNLPTSPKFNRELVR